MDTLTIFGEINLSGITDTNGIFSVLSRDNGADIFNVCPTAAKRLARVLVLRMWLHFLLTPFYSVRTISSFHLDNFSLSLI